MSMRGVKDMLLVGGHVVLDFINTVDIRNGGFGPDYLTDYTDLLTFSERTGLLGQSIVMDLERRALRSLGSAQRALSDAIVFREVLYRICRSEVSGEAVSTEDVKMLDEKVRDAANRRIVTFRSGAIGLSWSDPPEFNAVVDRLAVQALGLLTTRDERRLIRECPGRNCGWLFLDTSKGGRRRWCCDRTCGTHARVAKFRAR